MSENSLSLRYHESDPPGKIEVVPTKPCRDKNDLSLAYTPGVAEASEKISLEKEAAYRYSSKGNLVGILTNGTAVLGLGSIGALAAKPVMEGKSMLFKRFADIDSFDIEIEEKDPERFIEVAKAIAPTFGAINLEDIRAPECFSIEKELASSLDIPVFHDDQHGTAVVVGAALLNALECANKKIAEIAIAISGAGAAGLACAEFLVSLGADPERMVLADIQGVLHRGRSLHPVQERWARKTEARTLAEILVGADFFLGVSAGGILSPEMLASMKNFPIVFALANPVPEISYEAAKKARPDCLLATGRSDTPNQVNNALAFPFLFRGALDVRAERINEPMKLAAARELAQLAHEAVPPEVRKAYEGESLSFGPNYLIPKLFDARLLSRVSLAVAEAAIASGCAKKEGKNNEGLVFDRENYRRALEARSRKIAERFEIS
ncbi:MAG TPA: malate dehydrogenase [Cyanobacteria bacterium UBA8530]|nr:malate dehydrogenase [Cyanobacteria bacterium UBA8530]